MNGHNIAHLSSTDTDTDVVSSNNVNYYKNADFFHNNDPGTLLGDPVGVPVGTVYQTIEADGFTAKLTAYGEPYENEWNTINIVVGDGSDAKSDS